MKKNRVIWIVLDSVGVGYLPDADKFGDEGANTVGNISRAVGKLNLSNMEKLGLGYLTDISGVSNTAATQGAYGKLMEAAGAKDTTTGHWEMAGCIMKDGFPTFHDGFPKEVIEKFEELIGTKTIGNISASGTQIIEDLGEEHLKTGYPIIYTSADSVFQIATNEAIFPVEKLYEMCRMARKMLTGKYAVGRVIARPFIGDKKGNFKRTPKRHDFSLVPPIDTVLDKAKKAGLPVYGIGKINDIYAGKGITDYCYTSGNTEGMQKIVEKMQEVQSGIIMTNLVDFDMLYGHRNDFVGYAKALEEFDNFLPQITGAMKEDDLLIITADHGCDPTFRGTDHTREYIPVLLYGSGIKSVNIGVRNTFSDIGATISEALGIEQAESGTSFYNEII